MLVRTSITSNYCMCFSPSASFIAGASLLAVGAGSIKYAQEPQQNFFAVIPILFAAQQFFEGFLWLSLINSDFSELQTTSMYGFLLFAQVIWPTWVPLSIWSLEEAKKKKKIQTVFLWMGILVSTYLAFCLLYFPVNTAIVNGHIQYKLDFPHTEIYLLSIMYFIPIVISPFFSSVKYMKILGALVFASFLITSIFFNENLISVWCFFAATISVVVLFIVRNLST